MAVWVISDLHLSLGVVGKNMDVFGEQWKDHYKKIQSNWMESIALDDLVLIAGDISWAMRIEDAMPDLDWLHRLNGVKVMIRGNHDYWWGSVTKVLQSLPSSIKIVQNNGFDWEDISIGGTRLWDSEEYGFNDIIDVEPSELAGKFVEQDLERQKKIFARELNRLELSLKNMNPAAKTRIVMTHYPPIGADMKDSATSKLLERYNVNICVFGHLHGVRRDIPIFGEKNNIRYILTSCDYIDFKPIQIA